MLKLRRVTKAKVFFLVLVYVFNFDLFEFPAAILEKGLYHKNGFAPIFYRSYVNRSIYFCVPLHYRGYKVNLAAMDKGKMDVVV